jgi:hypothetical protein
VVVVVTLPVPGMGAPGPPAAPAEPVAPMPLSERTAGEKALGGVLLHAATPQTIAAKSRP